MILYARFVIINLSSSFYEFEVGTRYTSSSRTSYRRNNPNVQNDLQKKRF